jgi:hypothetical protein
LAGAFAGAFGLLLPGLATTAGAIAGILGTPILGDPILGKLDFGEARESWEEKEPYVDPGREPLELELTPPPEPEPLLELEPPELELELELELPPLLLPLLPLGEPPLVNHTVRQMKPAEAL